MIEGQEKQAFWDAIGGKGEYISDKRLQEENTEHPPRLFQISNASGTFTCEEIPEFCQQDLCTDDCMMLDLWDDVYIWIGLDAREDEKKEAERLALVPLIFILKFRYEDHLKLRPPSLLRPLVSIQKCSFQCKWVLLKLVLFTIKTTFEKYHWWSY